MVELILQEQEKMILMSNTEMSAMKSPDKAPSLRISNDFWILSFDTIFQLNQLFSNSEAALMGLKPTRSNVCRFLSSSQVCNQKVKIKF